MATFTANVDSLVNGGDISSPVVFDVAISFIQAVFGSLVEDPEFEKSIVPSIFIFSYLPSLQHNGDPSSHPSPAQQTGTKLWQEWLQSASQGSRAVILDIITGRLKNIIDDPKAYPLCVYYDLFDFTFLNRLTHKQAGGCSGYGFHSTSRIGG